MNAEDQHVLDLLDQRISAWDEKVSAEAASLEGKRQATARAIAAQNRAQEAYDEAKVERDRLVAAREALAPPGAGQFAEYVG